MIYVPPGKEVQVASEAGHYRRLRQHRAMLAKLSFQSLALIDELTGALESKEAIPRRKANGSKARSRSRRSKKKAG